MPRFVLLRHECPPGFKKPSHWDFMLECDEALLTWSLEELPLAGGAAVAATRLDKHRLAYLDYEGPVSRKRGEVHRVDAGEFDWIVREPTQVIADCRGTQFGGRIELVELKAPRWGVKFRINPDS